MTSKRPADEMDAPIAMSESVAAAAGAVRGAKLKSDEPKATDAPTTAAEKTDPTTHDTPTNTLKTDDTHTTESIAQAAATATRNADHPTTLKTDEPSAVDAPASIAEKIGAAARADSPADDVGATDSQKTDPDASDSISSITQIIANARTAQGAIQRADAGTTDAAGSTADAAQASAGFDDFGSGASVADRIDRFDRLIRFERADDDVPDASDRIGLLGRATTADAPERLGAIDRINSFDRLDRMEPLDRATVTDSPERLGPLERATDTADAPTRIGPVERAADTNDFGTGGVDDVAGETADSDFATSDVGGGDLTGTDDVRSDDPADDFPVT